MEITSFRYQIIVILLNLPYSSKKKVEVAINNDFLSLHIMYYRLNHISQNHYFIAKLIFKQPTPLIY